MDAQPLVEVLDQLVAEGIDGPWRRYSSSFNDHWAAAGFLKAQRTGGGRIVLELLMLAREPGRLVRVYQEAPLVIHYAKRAVSAEGILTIVKEGRMVFEAQPAGETGDPFEGMRDIELLPEAADSPQVRALFSEALAGLEMFKSRGIAEMLNPVPPPFFLSEIPGED